MWKFFFGGPAGVIYVGVMMLPGGGGWPSIGVEMATMVYILVEVSFYVTQIMYTSIEQWVKDQAYSSYVGGRVALVFFLEA